MIDNLLAHLLEERKCQLCDNKAYVCLRDWHPSRLGVIDNPLVDHIDLCMVCYYKYDVVPGEPKTKKQINFFRDFDRNKE